MFFYVLIFLTLTHSTRQTEYPCNSSSICGCSSNEVITSRIVGGENASIGTWGWTVSLLINNYLLCSGSIISDSWIITAAHCVYQYLQSPIIVYAGSNFLWFGTQNRTVIQKIVHPEFDSVKFLNDIALLKLSSPLDMSDGNISAICLPSVKKSTLNSGEWPVSNQSVVTVGWGRLSYGGHLPDRLQQVTLQTINSGISNCRLLIVNTTVQFCAGAGNGTKDACQGDSGGPLMLYSSLTKQWILVGLTSSGYRCAMAGYSGIYTRVAVFKDWIESYTNESYWVEMDDSSHADYTFPSMKHIFLFLIFSFVYITPSYH
ncbi:unnamed protein product [Adineta ricciae]|uniref:Peptidase S1 domain-containing protein n=1 Tax=Adineta ricciae TaxID=249248 RepID=A0A813Z164_ADIRI|nr:unnamed protein product [Adineta ricciae]CAF1576329.1 unnamed protein product [Adineta ricciae]